jgi:hypothetical protein
MEYSFMFYVNQDLPFVTIKEIVNAYALGELSRIQCITQLDGVRRIVVHYKYFTNVYLRYMLDLTSWVPYCPCILYGPNYLWCIYKTLTLSQRTRVHFTPIQRNS